MLSLDYSAIQESTLDDISSYDLVTTEGNIDADPCFVDPGFWDDSGTPSDPNDDIYVLGDYHLKSQTGHWDVVTNTWVLDSSTSPCIDTGDPVAPIGEESFPNGGIVNMGAYGGTIEASKSYFSFLPCETIIAGDINGDCRVDFEDLAILLSHWLEDCSQPIPEFPEPTVPPSPDGGR